MDTKYEINDTKCEIKIKIITIQIFLSCMKVTNKLQVKSYFISIKITAALKRSLSSPEALDGNFRK